MAKITIGVPYFERYIELINNLYVKLPLLAIAWGSNFEIFLITGFGFSLILQNWSKFKNLCFFTYLLFRKK